MCRVVWLIVVTWIALCVVPGCGKKKVEGGKAAGTAAQPRLAAAPAPVRGTPGPVVGIKSAELYASEDLVDSSSTLPEGTELFVVEVRGDKLEVTTADRLHGWVRRCATCSPSEYQRRKGANQVPQSVVCVGAKGEQLFMYGGSISISMNEPVAGTGQAFWMDPTAEGKQFTIGSRPNIGDPEVLLFVGPNDSISRLPIWKGG